MSSSDIIFSAGGARKKKSGYNNMIKVFDSPALICPTAVGVKGRGASKVSTDIIPSRSVTIPDVITVRFKIDYNIRNVDRIIKAKLALELEEINILKAKVKQLEANKSDMFTILEYHSLRADIEKLSKKIQSIESGERIDRYTKLSKPLIEKYDKIGKTIITVDIADRSEKGQVIRTDEDRERILAIKSYLEMAKEFIDIEIIHEHGQSSNQLECKGCGYSLDGVSISTEGQQICPSCGVERYVSKISKLIETSQDGSASCKEYSDKLNFKKAFYRFMGLQTANFDVKKICGLLDVYFKSVGYKSSKQYLDQPLNERGRKDGTSLTMMIDGLKHIKHSSLYEDSNLIASHIWGWKLPNLLHLEKTILADYDATQSVYDKMSPEMRDRKSCLSTQFRLFKHLQLRGCDVKSEDFKIPSQRDSLIRHDGLWKSMCEGCENTTIYYIPTL